MAEQTKAKLIQDRQEEEARIALLCGEEGLAPSEDNVAQCSMKCFAKLLAPQARKFIKYRSNMTANQLNALKKPSTALQDALAGVKNVVSEAYALRAVKSRLLAAVVNPTQNETTAVQVGTNYNSPLAVHVPLADPTASIIMPSTILQDAAKVKLIIDTFDPQGKLKHIDVVRPLEKTLVDRVDMLFEKLQVRLNGHVSRKVRLNQQSHYVWKWARKNLAIVTVWMVVVSQVKDNIAPLDEYKCLLSPKKDRFFLCTNVESVLFGCYLFFDTNDNIWIRSGKATGADGFGGRLGEHASRALSNLNEDGSKFYDLYPSKHSSRSTNRGTSINGYYEDLVVAIAVAFDGGSEELANRFAKNYDDEGGIFFYTADEKKSVLGTKFPGKDGNRKFMDMVAYLFELGYDLALSRSNNVSKSPGFEACGMMPVIH